MKDAVAVTIFDPPEKLYYNGCGLSRGVLGFGSRETKKPKRASRMEDWPRSVKNRVAPIGLILA